MKCVHCGQDPDNPVETPVFHPDFGKYADPYPLPPGPSDHMGKRPNPIGDPYPARLASENPIKQPRAYYAGEPLWLIWAWSALSVLCYTAVVVLVIKALK